MSIRVVPRIKPSLCNVKEMVFLYEKINVGGL